MPEIFKEKEETIKNIIKDMIEAGELNARLDEKMKTVTFADKEDDFEDLGQKVSQQTEEIRTIMEDMKLVKDDIEVSKLYQRRLIRSQEFGYEMEDD